MNKDRDSLANYIPEATVEPITEWLQKNKVELKISRARKTKLGDYRVARNGDSPRISVNHDLNKYAFLITLVHEMAHAEAWKNKSFFRRSKPHGSEWQQAFSKMMQPFLNEDVFPETLLPTVKNYFIKPKASSVSDRHLMMALRAFDSPSIHPHLSDLVAGDQFIFRGVSYEIVKKLRTRFQCRNLQNNRVYLIHGLAEVEKLGE